MEPSKIYIVVPCYNEKETIRTTISELVAKDYNVIVVNDGSTQNISNELQNLKIHYLKHLVNLGQGAAIQTGMEYAINLGAKIVIHFDADGQHNIEDIPKLINEILNGYDIVIGSRFLLKEDSITIPFKKRILLKVARYINFLFTGILLSDAHNGLRALNANALQKIQISENRMAHATEILKHVKLYKLNYKELPSHIIYTKYSLEKGQRSSNSINIIIDLILNKLS
jgi:polyprenyl-phospho-N-acetylgalactosaminyl synthase